ncbi:uncharacterized protein LOC127840603 [Dreissena polymorpha]|uniref:uncharacterized protein LOC127840603 n=1 Tax=Dreissena polymorpha TaxID=45954 RepID=UPI00226527B5|nr:uncharacterized protein LOC127840603 [Dreissena polymorpha]
METVEPSVDINAFNGAKPKHSKAAVAPSKMTLQRVKLDNQKVKVCCRNKDALRYLQQYTYYISKDRLQKGLLLDFFTQKKCTKPYFTFTEDQTGNYNVTSLSLYGAEYIKWSLERYEYKSYSNVSELKFEVLIAKYGSEILGVGRTDGDILFENGLIQLVCRKSCVGIVDTYIKTLLQFEGEKDFSIKTSDLEKTKELCKELVEDGYESVITNNEGPKLIVLFETYDEITKVSKRVQSIQGKDVKPTGRQRRHGAAADPLPNSNDSEQVKESAMSGRKMTCRPENLVKYSVGSFEIQVYKASICDLSVDCIVNAANDRLSHGAGVARAIADRAGDDLTKDGNKYIRSKGPIPVGDVAVTTAGLLPYRCVIHAVGPNWSDYDTNTPDGVQQCGKDLYQAVLNSFSMANAKGMKSVAIPAISSVKSKSPKERCEMMKDTDKSDDITLGAEMFWSGFLAYCENVQRKEKETRNLLDVYLVCNTNYTLSKTIDLLGKKNELLAQDVKKIPAGNVGNDITQEELKNQDTCVICMEKINEPKKLVCGHIFCRDCIDLSLSFKQTCPTCQCETHPSPGKMYEGISRTAYLPDNEQGRNICKMLKVAFERKLVFTIGDSRTTGHDGVITWNDIHHKTDYRAYSQFGYPDPTYLERVTDELKAKGVTLDDINPTDKLEGIITTD